jgi:hypothetical protein
LAHGELDFPRVLDHSPQRGEAIENLPAQFDSARPAKPDANQDGDQFRIGERLRTARKQSFLRPFILGSGCNACRVFLFRMHFSRAARADRFDRQVISDSMSECAPGIDRRVGNLRSQFVLSPPARR